MTQPARHPASDRLLFQRPSAGVRCGKSMTASLPLPDASPPPDTDSTAVPITPQRVPNGAHKRSQIPPHTSQNPHSENRCLGRYVNEFAGRHNTRAADTIDQMRLVAWFMVGKRLRYADLVK